MAKKDREKVARTGLVHRDGQQVKREKQRATPAKCDVPTCGNQQAIPKINDLPLCEAHAERFLTQLYFHDKVLAVIEHNRQEPGQTKSGLYLPTGSKQERAAMRSLAAGFNPRRR